METVSGVSNWKLVIRREEQAVCILRGVTCDERAVLPEELFGLPVTELGATPSAHCPARADGEEVLVSCGLTGGEAQWDNRRLTDLTLPAALRKVGDYALLNCSNLKTLRLHDGCDLLGRRCTDELPQPRIPSSSPGWGEQQESLSYFADELSRELDVTIYETDGQMVHLVFPEYVEAYEENCPPITLITTSTAPAIPITTASARRS